MQNVVIDCEFDGDRLLSMALVPEQGEPFYEVLPYDNVQDEWVQANVVPILNRPAITRAEFTAKLEKWLHGVGSFHLVADWPADIVHFCQSLITGPGIRIHTPNFTMGIRRDLDDAVSELPHNALADALGIATLLYGSRVKDKHGISPAMVFRSIINNETSQDRSVHCHVYPLRDRMHTYHWRVDESRVWITASMVLTDEQRQYVSGQTECTWLADLEELLKS